MLVFCLLLSLCLAAWAGPIGTAPASMLPSKRDTPKFVVCHFMVGNTYPYTVQDWLSDVILAHASGIDAFALNVGSDAWQPTQVKNAYDAAQQSGTDFKLFLSFDMTSLPCSSSEDAATLRNYITTYSTHPNAFIYNGRPFASTFSGETCQFGQGSVQSGWLNEFLQQLSGENSVHFNPSFFVATSAFQDFKSIISGIMNWNGAWPTQITAASVSTDPSLLGSLSTESGVFTTDEEYISALSAIGATYMPAASPWLFTHYSEQTYGKNFVYTCDEHLYVKRWEYLISKRDQFDIVQVLTYNDYGESHYLGPIEGAQPNSEAWVNGFDHTAWLNMTSYYAAAFKTGTYPSISKDQIFMWCRPHPALATAPDPVGRPTNYQILEDKIWVVVFATSSATVVLSSSSTESQTFSVEAGATKLSLPIKGGGFMQAVLQRNGQTVINLKPDNFTFDPSPSSYNYNAFVVSSS